MSAVLKIADKKALKTLIPLNGLSAHHVDELARKAHVITIEAGKFLFKKGERDNSTCYVLDGEIALHDGSDIKLTIQGRSEEARHPIAPQQPRQLSARAKVRTTVISIDSGLLDVMLAWEQSSGFEVDEMETEGEEDWMTRMMQSDLLQKLPAINLQKLFMRMEEVAVKSSEVIVNQDDEGDYYYIIKNGTCIVSRRPSANARAVKLAELKVGDSFGEESLLSGAKRNATVTMLTEGCLMRLSKKDFDELLKTPLLNQITYEEAKELKDKGAIYLDVRLPGEFNNANLPGSINIPLAAIRNELEALDKSETYIIYCDTGRRSTSAGFLFGQFGIDAKVLKDGISSVPIDEYDSNQAKSEKAPEADVIDINRDREVNINEKPQLELESMKKEKQNLENNIKKLTIELESLRGKVSETEQEISERDGIIAELKEVVEKEHSQLGDMEVELEGLQNSEVELARLKEQLADAEGEMELQKTLLSTAQESDESTQKLLMDQNDKLSKLEQSLQAAVERAAQAEKIHDTEEEKINGLQKENDLLTNTIAELGKQASEADDLRAANEKIKEELQSAITKAGDITKVHKDDLKQLNQLKSESEKLAKVIQGLEKKAEKSEQMKNELASLKKENESLQSDASENIIELKKDLEGMQKNLSELQDERNKLDNDLISEREQIKSLASELEQVKASEQESLEKIKQIEADNKSIESARSLAENEKAKVEAALEGSRLALNESAEANKAQLEKLASLEKQVSDFQQEKIALESELKAAAGSVAELNDKAAALNEKLNLAESDGESKIASLDAQLKESVAENAELQKRVKSLESDHQTLQQQVISFQQEADKQSEEIRVLAEEKETVEKSLKKTLLDNESLRQNLGKQEKESEINQEELKNQVLEIANARKLLEKKLDFSSREVEELRVLTERYESNEEGADAIVLAELAEARETLKENEEKLIHSIQTSDELKNENEEIRKELAALQGVYNKKESDVSSLEKEVAAANAELEKLKQAGSDYEGLASAQKELQSSLESLQSEKNKQESEYQAKIAELEQLLEVNEKLIQEHAAKVEELTLQQSEAASSEHDFEDERSALQKEISDLRSSVEARKLTEGELEKEIGRLKKERLDWEREHNEAAQSVELEFIQSKVKDLESKLGDSEKNKNEYLDKIEALENQLSLVNDKSNQDGGLDIQKEQLKREMEKQLEQYKSEVDGDSEQLKKENNKLRIELQQMHDDYELAVKTGRNQSGGLDLQDEDDDVLGDDAENVDHSALFDLPDIDKNLFANNAPSAATPGGNNIVLMIVVAIVFSVLSAGGVYWYMNQEKQVPVVAVGSSAEAGRKTTAAAIKQAGQKSAAKVAVRKPLFNLDAASANKKQTSVVPARKEKSLRVFKDALKIGSRGPSMVSVSSGSFEMGSPSSSVHFEERPMHKVSLSAFSISRYEVSFAEYDRFAAATGRPRPSDNGWGRKQRPVINVTWDDAVAYTKWLSAQTGHVYRLPTEAEWEYAARAGTQTRFWWGAQVGKNKANCFNCGSSWDRISTAPVGRFKANPFGLHDMTGNVMEWVADCYHANYDAAPVTGKARVETGCKAHVVRGGSYRSTSDNIRVTRRSEFKSDSALDQIGFRVVRVR